MKNIKITAVAILLGACAFYGCHENVEPQNMVLDKSQLIGTWSAGARSVTISVGENNGQRTIYHDSTFIEDIGVLLDFGVEGVADSVVISEITVGDDGELDTAEVAKGRYSFGHASNLEYSGPETYFTVYDPNVPQGVEGGYRTTYTIENLTDNSMEVTWSFNNRRSRNSRQFVAQFSK